MALRLLVALAVAAVFSALPSAGTASAQAAAGRSSEASEARNVTSTFFRSLNARKYERTCALLADAYFAASPGSTRRTCAIGLRTAFMWSQEIRWRITHVRVAAGRVVVDTVADGAAGSLVLVRERGSLRILTLARRSS